MQCLLIDSLAYIRNKILNLTLAAVHVGQFCQRQQQNDWGTPTNVPRKQHAMYNQY